MKRIMSSMLLLVLILMCFTACDGNEAAVSPSVAATPAPTASVPPETAAPDTDDGPAPLYPLVNEPVTFTMFTSIHIPNTAGLISSWNEHPIYQKAEEITGVYVEFECINTPSAAEQLMVRLAGDDYTDMFYQCLMYSNYTIDAAIENDILVDLSGYIDSNMPNLSAIIADEPTVLKDMTSDTGKIAATYSLQIVPTMPGAYMVRKDLLDELGMDLPATYDDYYNVLTAFKTEYGMSDPIQIDNYGFQTMIYGGFDVSLSISDPRMGANGRAFYLDNGEVKFGFIEEEFRDYVTMMNQWYNDGLMTRDLLIRESDLGRYEASVAMRANGQSGIYEIGGSEALQMIDNIEKADADLVPITVPVMNKGDRVHFTATTKSTLQRESYSITTQCSDPALAASWIDFWYSEEGSILANYGTQGVSYELGTNGKPYFTDYVLSNSDGLTSMEVLYINTNTFLPCVVDPERSNALAPEKYKDANAIWASNVDKDYQLPGSISLSADEAASLNSSFADIETYIKEAGLQFIVGEKPLSEVDEFFETIKAFGIEQHIETMQAAYERYLER